MLTRYKALLLENCCIRNKVKAPVLGAFTPGGIENKTHTQRQIRITAGEQPVMFFSGSSACQHIRTPAVSKKRIT